MLIVKLILYLQSNVAIHHATIGSIIYVKMNTTAPNINMDLICVDKIVETFSKSVDIENKHFHILLNNKPVDVIDISEDNEEVDDVDTNVVTDVIINEVTEEVTDEICVDKNNKVIQIEVHMNKYGVEEKIKDKAVNIDIVKGIFLQDKMTDHYLDHYHKKQIFHFYQVISNSLQRHGRPNVI